MLIAIQNKEGQEENGMFTKKYVGPVNCASCEKNITNLCAMPVDYHVWKRLPFREPTERIARVSYIFISAVAINTLCPERLVSLYFPSVCNSMARASLRSLP